MGPYLGEVWTKSRLSLGRSRRAPRLSPQGNLTASQLSLPAMPKSPLATFVSTKAGHSRQHPPAPFRTGLDFPLGANLGDASTHLHLASAQAKLDNLGHNECCDTAGPELKLAQISIGMVQRHDTRSRAHATANMQHACKSARACVGAIRARNHK